VVNGHNTMESKVAVVSGGAGGIGNAVVLRLQQDGFFPVILDLNEAAGQETLAKVKKSGGHAEFIALNLTRKSDVQNAFSSIISNWGRIDVLVNLAGGTLHAKLIQDFPLIEWLEVINVNLKGTFLCCQAAIDVMRRREKGSIVNTASNFGITGSPRRTAYSASKAAVIAFTKSLALEMAPFGIRVNTIAPGLTATKRVMSHSSADGWAKLCEAIPMKRAAEPSDIAEGVAFLAGEESSYMTGQTLHVNGGLVLP
jgi:NAD(P)-dependent dehydrogenase (short-subunit alcohol dehydrogenase family)